MSSSRLKNPQITRWKEYGQIQDHPSFRIPVYRSCLLLAIKIHIVFHQKTQPWTCSSIHDKLRLNRPRTGEDMFPPPPLFFLQVIKYTWSTVSWAPAIWTIPRILSNWFPCHHIFLQVIKYIWSTVSAVYILASRRNNDDAVLATSTNRSLRRLEYNKNKYSPIQEKTTHRRHHHFFFHGP